MKKFLLLFIIFALLCFTSCTYTAEENTEAQFQYQQEILLFIVDTVFPYQQYITVISETGEQYCFSYSGSDSMPNYWHSSDKNWYDKLIVLMTEENKTEHSLEENDLNLILNQISQFQNYRTKEIEIISRDGADMGNQRLFGVYSDENGNPQFCFLADYGDEISCLNDSAAVEFINALSDSQIFYTDYVKPYHYSIDEENSSQD